MEPIAATTKLDFEAVELEFPRNKQTVYLNTGTTGRKPVSVLSAIMDGWQQLNDNPTLTTFLDPSPLENARAAVAGLHKLPERSILLIPNPSQGLHLLMQSFLRNPGDELVTTTHEHGSAYAIARHLEETRGVVVRKLEVDPTKSSTQLAFSLLDLVTPRTKLVLVSEISCTSGWCPDLNTLSESLALLEVPLLVDGAHVSGHLDSSPASYPLWVGSGHKWLGGPNGTGFAYIAPHLVPLLEPVWLGDHHFDRKDADIEDLTRFEQAGTSDVVRWIGLTGAIELYKRFNPKLIGDRQNALVDYLRMRLDAELNPVYRTALAGDDSRKTALVTFNFPAERVKVDDLTLQLWERHRICVRSDFVSPTPHLGIRVSCHYSITEADIDTLIEALKTMVDHA